VSDPLDGSSLKSMRLRRAVKSVSDVSCSFFDVEDAEAPPPRVSIQT
tara:strand:- start:244 stop:384 length:141 start_codon:yes stop_codon:yes gene_type:complete